MMGSKGKGKLDSLGLPVDGDDEPDMSEDSEESSYDDADEGVAEEFLAAVKSGDPKEVLRAFAAMKAAC